LKEFLLGLKLYFVFVDYSGDPSKPKSSSPHEEVYVLSALIMHEEIIDSVEDTIGNILQDLNIDRNAEIHVSSIVHPKEHYSGLPIDVRKTLLDRIYDYIANLDCTIISIVIYKQPIEQLSRRDYIFRLQETAYELLIERLAKFFDKINIRERVLIIIDESFYKRDTTIRTLVKRIITSGLYVPRINASRLFFRVPLFYDSRDIRALQLTDAISYAVFKKHTKPRSHIFDFTIYYNKILPKFDKCPNTNRIEGCGLKHWTFIG